MLAHSCQSLGAYEARRGDAILISVTEKGSGEEGKEKEKRVNLKGMLMAQHT
jgi:hypothetical protein